MDLDFHSHVAEAVREMSERSGVGDTLERAVQMCVETIAHCDMAGVSVVTDRSIETLVASDEDLRSIDDLQFRIHEGPCLDALRVDDFVTSGDLAHDTRWPTWGPELAARTGMRSSMSFRLFNTRGSFGVLNMYASRTDAFDHEDVLEGHVLAAMTAASAAASIKEAQLEQAIASRTVIGQATGMVMERFGLDADAAFSVIRRLSQAHNVKIHTLAREMVATGQVPLQTPQRDGSAGRALADDARS